MASCSNRSSVYTVHNTDKESGVSSQIKPAERLTGGAPVSMVPNATVFRMSGDFEDNVAVSLGADGELTYFPAPSDITAYSRPINLGEGWWLNCQGLGPNSVFTKYTFAEYSELTETPSPEQIKKMIIPGARVTQFMELPMKINQAEKNIDEVKNYVKNK